MKNSNDVTMKRKQDLLYHLELSVVYLEVAGKELHNKRLYEMSMELDEILLKEKEKNFLP
jgi:hypothetical protein